jgi:hypothetical protein
MRTLRVKPAPGLKIRNPDRDNRLLDQAGEDVPSTAYWRARLRDGDVLAVLPGAPKPGGKSTAKADGG